MEAVTSVLLERARHDTGLPRMVTASLVGHIALLTVLAAVTAIGGRTREPDLRDVMTISLGGAAGPNAGGMGLYCLMEIKDGKLPPSARQLTPDEARSHPQKHVIYKNLGDRASVAPDTSRVELQPGDQLLLCSDGLWDYIDENLLYQTVLKAPSPQVACRELIPAANANGGPDNITAIIVQMESLG